MMNIDQTKYVIIDRQELGKTIKRNLAPLKEQGLLGRPFKLTEPMVKDILNMLEQGISYSKISQKHNISKTIVCRIKQKGIAIIDQIRKKKKKDTESMNTNTEISQIDTDQHILSLNKYAEKLQRNLKKHNIYLNLSECYGTIKDILVNDDIYKDQKTRYEYDYYEYCPAGEYIELTSHTLNKQKRIR